MNHFKLKDIPTSINLFCVLLSLILIFEKNLIWASYILVFGILILDHIDGWVARRLGGGNQFGYEFDTIVDFCASCMAVPLLIYAVYKDYSEVLGAITAFFPLFFGTLRGIRARIEPLKVKNFYVGLLRPATGLASIAVVNSSIIKEYSLYIVGTVIILVFSLANVSHALYIGNDKKTLVFSRKMKVYLAIAAVSQLLMTSVGCFWDGIVIFLFAYMINPYVLKPEKDKQIFIKELEPASS